MSNIIKTLINEVQFIEDNDLISQVQDLVKKSQDKINVINNEMEYSDATYVLSNISENIKSINTHKKRIMDEINKIINPVKEYYKLLLTLLDDEEKRIRGLLNDFLKKKKEEEEKELNELSEILGEDVIEPVEIKLRTSKTTTKQYKIWEVEDINQVPREYLTIDESKINKIRKDYGIYDKSPIPGIKFTYKNVVQLK